MLRMMTATQCEVFLRFSDNGASAISPSCEVTLDNGLHGTVTIDRWTLDYDPGSQADAGTHSDGQAPSPDASDAGSDDAGVDASSIQDGGADGAPARSRETLVWRVIDTGSSAAETCTAKATFTLFRGPRY